MQVSRYLAPELVKLEMSTRFDESEEGEEGATTPRQLLDRKEQLLAELADVLDLSGKVGNKSKLIIDLFNREKKATTGIGRGIAIPHVRTLQAKELIVAVCRSTAGYEFDSLDGQPVHIFVPMAAPPYDDNLYLRVFRALAEIFHTDGFFDRIMAAEAPYDVIRAFKEVE